MSVGGNRSHLVVIATGDRDNRPTDQAEGEVAVYSKFGNKMVMKADGSIEITGAGALQIGGVVTQDCICAFTGAPHPDASTTVKASK